MVEKYQPLVSVYVITYNSSKTVIETLDSIYNQTYPNIELIVSDDCSPDNTVAMCREWIAAHKDRFVRTELLTVEKNTGISANGNRAEAACQGEWVKGIAGDDLLVEDCIDSCVDYVSKNKNVVVLFGRQDAFGADENICKEVNSVFDYVMLQESTTKQLHKLLFENNYVPATTLFYHKSKLEQMGVKNDERIPLLEDWPKWINLLKAGVKFHFVDKVLVKYRVGGISSADNRWSQQYYESHRRFFFYYQFPSQYEASKDDTLNSIIQQECELYKELRNLEKSYSTIVNSHAYKLGRVLLKPLFFLRKKS